MLKIRLARVGKRKKPTYRFIVNEAARDTYGKALEILGHYDPFQKIIEIKKDRVLHWISQGAKLSPTVHNIFVDQNIIEAEKIRASKSKKKKGGEEEAKPEGEKPAASEQAPAAEEKAEEKPEAEAKPEEKEEKKEEVKQEAPAEEEEKKEEPKS